MVRFSTLRTPAFISGKFLAAIIIAIASFLFFLFSPVQHLADVCYSSSAYLLGLTSLSFFLILFLDILKDFLQSIFQLTNCLLSYKKYAAQST